MRIGATVKVVLSFFGKRTIVLKFTLKNLPDLTNSSSFFSRLFLSRWTILSLFLLFFRNEKQTPNSKWYLGVSRVRGNVASFLSSKRCEESDSWSYELSMWESYRDIFILFGDDLYEWNRDRSEIMLGTFTKNRISLLIIAQN